MIAALLLSSMMPQTPEIFVEDFPKHLTSLKMVRIPDSDKVKGLYVSQTEVPWEVFDIWVLQLDQSIEEQTKVRPETISRPSRPYAVIFTGFGHHEYPAICMSLNSAKEFCRWLNKNSKMKYRIPTREEWQYLAGPSPANADEMAWHWDNAEDTTHKVAQKIPNTFGIYDAYGNAAEWVEDKDGKSGVMGGSWKTKPDLLKNDFFQPFDPKWNEADPQNPKSKWWLANGQFVGLRLVCTK